MNADTRTALLKASEKMKRLKEMCNKALDDLKTTRKRTLEAIEKLRHELNDMLDKLELKTKKEVDEQYESVEREWQEVIEKGGAIAQKLENELDQLEKNESNASQQFVVTKMSKESILWADAIESVPCSIEMSFCESERIKSWLKEVSSLGNVSHRVDKKMRLCSH